MYDTVLYKTAITFGLWKICARKAIELAREIVIRAQSGVAQFRTFFAIALGCRRNLESAEMAKSLSSCDQHLAWAMP